MSRKISTVVAVCIAFASLAGCTYEPDLPLADGLTPTTSASVAAKTFTLPDPLKVQEPIAFGGIQPSRPLPSSGECSFDEAAKWPVSGVVYLGPTNFMPSLKSDIARIHFENSMTVSLPEDTYLRLKTLTPEIADTPATIFEITRESFASLMQNSVGLKSFAVQYSAYASQTFFVTSYRCIPLSGIK